MAAPGGPAHLRGARAAGPHLRGALQRRRHPPDRWRADRAGPPAGARRASWPGCGCPATADSPLAGQKPDLSITTNGATFRLLAHELRDAGLDRVNISLDSLRRERFLAITRRDDLEQGARRHRRRQEAGFDPVKVNCVVERGVNDDEIVDLAAWGRDTGVSVRFIEFMPLDASGAWDRSKVVGPGRDRRRHRRRLPARAGGGRGAAPADRWRYARRQGRRRRHPQRHEAVLRRLRPGAAHRRGTVPHVPVRDAGVRPARPSCAAAAATTTLAAGDRAGRGHEVGRPRHRPGARSCGRTAR